MDEKIRKRMLRKEIGKYGWFALLYYFFLNYVVITIAELQLLKVGFDAVIRADSWMAFAEGVEQGSAALMDNGWGYLLAGIAFVCAIPLFKGRSFWLSLFEQKQMMTGKVFFRLLCLFFGGQMVFQLLAIVEELILNQFGLSILESMEMASAGADSFSMFLYMGIAAPVVEELLFRGVLMRGLARQGNRFAIVASSILFGLFHGNLVQSPYAFAVGLVLGYAAMEYSIGWAMVLHMMNNLVLGDSLLRFTSLLPTGVGDFIYGFLFLGCFAGSIVILIRNRTSVRLWLQTNPPARGGLRAFLTTPSLIILILMLSGNALLMLMM